MISATNIKLQIKDASFKRACAKTPWYVAKFVTCALSPYISSTFEALLGVLRIRDIWVKKKKSKGYRIFVGKMGYLD